MPSALKSALAVVLCVCVCALTYGAWRVLGAVESVAWHVDAVVQSVPAQVDAQLAAIRKDALAEVRHAVDLSGGKIDAVISETAEWRKTVDARIGDAVMRADSRLAETTESVSGLRADLKPVLANSAALAANANASWDDLYWDLKASVESATVAATSIARTSEVIAAEAPKTAKASADLTEQAAGIAGDVHTFTTRFVAPKPWYKRVWSAVVTGLDIIF